jgi:glycerol-3-phosphate dehydrogenase (NAD(P)+)
MFERTFAGLAGMGDLFATCSSPLSRNNTFGANLGRGMTLQETIAETKQTAEGVKSCLSVLDLAHRHGADMPITNTVVDIAHSGKPPQAAAKELMSRSAKPERH